MTPIAIYIVAGYYFSNPSIRVVVCVCVGIDYFSFQFIIYYITPEVCAFHRGMCIMVWYYSMIVIIIYIGSERLIVVVCVCVWADLSKRMALARSLY